MKVLFLDIDGVMNSSQSARKNNKSYDVLMPEALAYIQSLHSQGIKIVVSSMWRKFNTIKELEDILKVPVYGITPVLNNYIRGVEIERWINLHNRDDTIDYAIIDDDTDILISQEQFFIKTDRSIGMTEANYNAIRNILGLDITEKKIG